MFKKYILTTFISLALLFSLFLCYKRLSWERNYRNVSIVVDHNSLYDLALQQGKPFEKIIEEMRAAGVTAVGIKEDTLSDLKRQNRIEIVYGSHFHRVFSETGTTYILIGEKELAQRIARALRTSASLQEKSWQVKMPGVNPYFEENEGLGFSEEPIKVIKKARLKIVLRPLTVKALEERKEWAGVEAVVFPGKTVPGYPDNVAALQKVLACLPVKIGVIEFNSQLGFSQLLSPELKKRAVRVHSLSEKEIEDIEEEKRKATMDDLIERWTRAVRERNVRLLYLHFFHRSLNGEFDNAGQWNAQYVREIVSRVGSLGYTFSGEDTIEVSFFDNSKLRIFILLLAIFSLALVLVKAHFPLLSVSLTTLFGGGLLFLAGIVIFFSQTLTAKIGALAAAIIVPLAAITWLERKLTASEETAPGYGKVVVIFSKVTILTMGGILLLVGFLYGQNFWLKLDAFSGIKVALVLPLIVSFFMVKRDFTWQKVLRQPFTLGAFLVGVSALTALGLYVWRSGNEGMMLVGNLERSLRSGLDQLLIVRPRTKEFLFGHPLLILFIYQATRGKRNSLLLLGGLVGQISILNTFVHAHSPLYISLLRTFHGWWLGILVGWFFIQVYERLLSNKKGEQLYFDLGAQHVSAIGYKILISGYYGFDNLGDELILKAIIFDLRALDKTIDITVISSNPARTMQLHAGIKAIKRTDIKSIFTACRECDVFLSGGGGLLQDSTGQGSVLYYLGLAWMAKLFMRKKVMVYAQGVGPLKKKLSRRLLQKGLEKINYITLRDDYSMTLLEEMKVKTGLLHVTADPVLGLDVPEMKKRAKQSALRLGIVLRKDHANKQQTETWAGIIEQIVTLPGEVWLIPFQRGEDFVLSKELQEKLSGKVQIKTWNKIEDIFSIFAEVDIVVSMRLHALILAALCRKPMIGVSYDPKIDYFLRSLGQQACRTEDVLACLKDISTLESHIVQKEKLKELRTLAKKNAELALELLRRSPIKKGYTNV